MEIVAVSGAAQIAQVRELLEEYWSSFGFTPCFQNFAAEMAGLPGAYAPPDGRLALALADGEAAGAIALWRVDDARAEAKRLYARPRFRGSGVGRALLDWVIAEARAAGYAELLGHTLPAMGRALAMYERAGFQVVAPFAEVPRDGSIFIRLKL